MSSPTKLEEYANDIVTAARALADHCPDAAVASSSPAAPSFLLPPDASAEAYRAKSNLLITVNKLHMLLTEPGDLIQHLASQIQLLACLQWLGEFQVLACIPLTGSVLAKDVAELVGVPETQLSRIVRMTKAAGFLHEPQPGHIAHTALSAPFVSKLHYFDAAMFLAGTVAPAALHMAAATQRQSESAYMAAFNTSQTFQSACEQRPKFRRHWLAYLKCANGVDDSVTDLLGRLDWLSLGNACIVDVAARSTDAAVSLANLYPALHFVVQLSPNRSDLPKVTENRLTSLNGRISVQMRAPGAPQMVQDAAVYLLHVYWPSLTMPSHALPTRILAELRAHLGVLRANPSATFVLALRVLPEPGTVDPDVETMARVRDLSLLQLVNEHDMDMAELVELVNSVHDSMGRLLVVNKLRSPNNATVALGVKYQAYSEAHGEANSLAR